MNFIQTTKNPKNTENPVSNTGQAPGLFNPFVPLRPSADTLPAFPIHCLPPRLQVYVTAVAEHTQTPVDMAAGVALGVLATCLQGKVRVEGNGQWLKSIHFKLPIIPEEEMQFGLDISDREETVTSFIPHSPSDAPASEPPVVPA